MVNPAKSISEGSEIEASKMVELEKYLAAFLKANKDTISFYAKSETTNITEIGKLND